MVENQFGVSIHRLIFDNELKTHNQMVFGLFLVSDDGII